MLLNNQLYQEAVCCVFFIRKTRWILLGVLFFAGCNVYGQGPSDNKRHNLRMGNVLFDLTTTMGVEYNDNISSSGIEPKSDIILKPGFIVNTEWRTSDINLCTLSMGVVYSKYMKNKQLDSANNILTLDRASNFKYMLKAGAYTFTLTDYFNFSADPTDAVAVNTTTSQVEKNVAIYSRFNNMASLAIDHREKNTAYNLTLSRLDLIPFQSQFKFTRRTEYTEALTISYIANSACIPGVRMGMSQNKYAQHFQNDSNSYFIGPIMQWRVTNLVNINASVSYGVTKFKGNGSNQDASGSRSKNVNASLQINHRMNKAYSHALSVGQNINFGFISNTTSVQNMRYDFSWRATKRITYNGYLNFEKGKDSGGLSPEKYNRYTGNLKFNYAINKQLMAALEASYTQKRSDVLARSYTNKRFAINLSYDV